MATAFAGAPIGTAKLYNLNDLTKELASTNFVVKVASGFSGALASPSTQAGVAPTPAVVEELGVDTLTFAGTFFAGDRISIDGKLVTLVTGGTAAATATEVAGIINTGRVDADAAALKAKYGTVADDAAGVLTFTEVTGNVDAVALTASVLNNATASVTAANTTLGVIGVSSTPGTKQVETLTINVTTAAIGEITVTFKDGVQTLVKTIATTATDTTTTVAGKIATEFGTELTNWDVSTSTNTVVFTAKVEAANNTNVTVTVTDKY